MTKHYEFWQNWQQFIEKHFSEDRLAAATSALLTSLAKESLHGMSFLDIGCGSGLHSLAAWRSGASRIVSFDYDQDSVATARFLWYKSGEPDNWHIMQGSVLDTEFILRLGAFDIVYSWGVLHHTGDMRQAIRNAMRPLTNNGVFFIALYSDTSYRDHSWAFGRHTPEEWLRIKQEYNLAGPLSRRIMEYRQVWRDFFAKDWPHPRRMLKTAVSLYKAMAKTKQEQGRGMEFWTDLRDWLGGWPMEFARERDILALCEHEGSLEPLRINSGEGNTEFLFRPSGCSNYWDDILAQRQIQALPSIIQHEGGNCYSVHLPQLCDQADTNGHERRSPLTVFEDGIPLGYRHAQKIGIEKAGEGRYSHFDDMSYFSSYDGSDPRTNGKYYTFTLQQ